MKKSIVYFFIGMSFGIVLPIIIAEGYNVDWQNANAVDVYKTFGFIMGGYAGYITLLISSIIIPIFLVIPQIGIHIKKESRTIRFIAGSSVGFGIMQLVKLYYDGFPQVT